VKHRRELVGENALACPIHAIDCNQSDCVIEQREDLCPHSTQSLLSAFAPTRHLGSTLVRITQWFFPLDRSYAKPACSKRLRVPL
jgi:hypothetical protein